MRGIQLDYDHSCRKPIFLILAMMSGENILHVCDFFRVSTGFYMDLELN